MLVISLILQPDIQQKPLRVAELVLPHSSEGNSPSDPGRSGGGAAWSEEAKEGEPPASASFSPISHFYLAGDLQLMGSSPLQLALWKL